MIPADPCLIRVRFATQALVLDPGANSLLSACVDGWFTLPYSVPNYLAGLLGQPTHSLSGGEAARVGLAVTRSCQAEGNIQLRITLLRVQVCPGFRIDGVRTPLDLHHCPGPRAGVRPVQAGVPEHFIFN